MALKLKLKSSAVYAELNGPTHWTEKYIYCVNTLYIHIHIYNAIIYIIHMYLFTYVKYSIYACIFISYNSLLIYYVKITFILYRAIYSITLYCI